MYLKKGVSLRGLQPQIVVALIMLSDALDGDFVVTSATDHAPNRIATSLHPQGLAIDVRIPDAPSFADERILDYHPSYDRKGQFKSLVSATFEDTDFDLVWYDTHVHIEWDPKP